MRSDSGRVLDLDSPETIPAVEDEVDLGAFGGAPEMEAAIAPRVGDPGTQMLRHETFEGRAVDLLAAVERPAGTQGTEDAGVEQVELGVSAGLAARSAGEDRHAKREQQVFQHLEVTRHRPALHLALARHLGRR